MVANPLPAPEKIWPSAVTKALLIEFLVFLPLAIAGFFATARPSGPFLYSLVALAASAMGIQSAAVQALGLRDISTTYITGTYTTFIDRLVSPRRSKTGKVTVEKRLYVYVIVMYVLAAIAGCAMETHWLRSPYYPSHQHRFCGCCCKNSYVLKGLSMLKIQKYFC
jgi:uncharacterized membrane protein YoaK (UPF0700 family)